MKKISKLNAVLNPFGYTVVPTDLWEQVQNELASLLDAIKVYEQNNNNKKED